ncbi:IS1 family transposase [Gilliamella sp. B2776]|uniref:hypothetical protein n=1 Tax=unclassified Gilliamella TaxID=2685620 RepID=UPI002269E55F|nr:MULTISPECIES: hypothetical protein [unclassified Gilliamella]MCX8648863.1 IS1 family transposase [Gilliamella sp. B2779]MCX8653261.1 IS1 family transposase [Gilliamella sp. B2737]MCX8655521.1 IS1 family transposase [Gilliamella sp. B2894]MCX8664286.1 IS1 family transposase [Gilliamella sp. B2887]MCX8690675.1 IS1 family transposase [Gilliamella sp. B2776]
MIYELIPIELHEELNDFRQDLERIVLQYVEVCPYCDKKEFYLIRSKPTTTYRCKACYKYFTAATNTHFNRLTPFNWLETIFISRIKNYSYQAIADKFDCSTEKIMRRDHAIMNHLKLHYLSLYKWYINKQQTTLNPILIEQYNYIKSKINTLLNTTTPVCLHCNSTETVKIGKRTCYRCKRCRHSFNLLSNTKLNRLPKPELWLNFIDLLLAGEDNIQIEKNLKLTSNTIRRWRSVWCEMMIAWKCDALSIWCSSH